MSETLKSNVELNVSNEAFDERLYEKFSEIASFQAYEYLDGNKDYRNEQKSKFLSGEIVNPVLDYPKIDIDKINQIETNLVSMKRELLLNEQNEVVKQTYRWRLNEKIAESRMLKAVAVGDMNRFMHYSEFIYGKSSPDIFNYTIDSIRNDAEKNKDSENIDIRIAATELLESLPVVKKPDFTDLPDQETVSFAHNVTVAELCDLINIPIEAEELDASRIQEIFQSALEHTGDTNWKVKIDEKTSKSTISVNQEKMQITVPAEKSVSKRKLEGLIVHEIGTHVTRRINGERSRLKLLGLGLDRYEVGDEGIANMRDQAVTGEVPDFKGLKGQLAIGLAAGVDGQPRDFRQVYNILEKYYLYTNLLKGKDLLESHNKAQKDAWGRCVRTFRGTDCQTPGACFTKDIIYREGNIGVWETIKNNPSEMLRFNIGKYNPSNPRHIWILEQLGISDQDLIELE